MTPPSPAPAPATAASPCTGVCRIDEASGWCAGCLRTIDEIAVWSLLDDGEKGLVRVALGERRRKGGGIIGADAPARPLVFATPPPPKAPA